MQTEIWAVVICFRYGEEEEEEEKIWERLGIWSMFGGVKLCSRQITEETFQTIG